LFWAGITGLLLFETAAVYFIMPFPGSQDMDSLAPAYFLYRWRWAFRIVFAAATIAGWYRSDWSRKWIPAVMVLLTAAILFMLNFRMSADHMFLQPKDLRMVTAGENRVEPGRLVIGVERDGQARAYPIRFLAYHHQVLDTIAGKIIMVTYCNVCRTGRVFEPTVDGRPETFRLVGMDRFNAMFEDASTGSWWRQATGEAGTGPLKGKKLPEVFSEQTSLGQWLALHPGSRIMQEDPAFSEKYDTTLQYEKGRSRKKLTGTDSLSWQRKSWVIGLSHKGSERAYDWNLLTRQKLIRDTLGGSPVFLVVSADSTSFFAFEGPAGDQAPLVRNDTLFLNGRRYRLDGRGIDTTGRLSRVRAYQEFWHSWETFHPGGGTYR